MAVRKAENSEDSGKRTCFVIMPFSDPEGYEPGHFRKIYDHTFAPAIREAGYEPLRIDDNSVSNLIHGKMMNALVTAPMVLCDLSTNNPNVLYELGIRHAFDLPVVLVQDNGQNRIFDVGGITTVEYHRSRLYEDVLEDQKKITEAIRQTANAKNKYSIMSLVALHAAKPASGESVTHEDKLEYMLRDLSRQVNSLDKKIQDTQDSRIETGNFSERYFAKEENLISLKRVMDEVEDYLDVYETSYDQAAIEDVDRYSAILDAKRRECLKVGLDMTNYNRSRQLLTRLSDLRKKLYEKRTETVLDISV